MITKEHVYNSIRDSVIEACPAIPIVTEVSSTAAKPFFTINYVSGRSKQTAEDYQRDEISFKVVYHSEEKTTQDIFGVEQTLNQIFKKPLKIETESFKYFQEVDDITTTFNEADYSLSLTLDLIINQLTELENRYDEYDNEEYMQELEVI